MSLHKKFSYLFFLLLVLSFSKADAQAGNNPFELQHRLEENDNTKTNTSSTTTNSTAPTDTNPFDINRKGTKPNTNQATTDTAENLTVTKKIPSKVSKKSIDAKVSLRFISWMITLMMLFLTLSVTLFKSLITKIYRAFMNDNFLKMIHREEKGIVSFPYIILYCLFFINLGIFSFLLIRHFQVPFSHSPILTLSYCIGGITIIFLIKHLLLIILGFTFPISKEIRQYSFTIIIFSIILGFILAPLNIFIAFAPTNLKLILIYLTFMLIIGIYLFRVLRSLFLASKYISLHKFHFFMYLCTIEIAPVLILAKIILLLTGIQ